jgi:uncharacterized oligopeptide transporter (OPT) family protein
MDAFRFINRLGWGLIGAVVIAGIALLVINPRQLLGYVVPGLALLGAGIAIGLAIRFLVPLEHRLSAVSKLRGSQRGDSFEHLEVEDDRRRDDSAR